MSKTTNLQIEKKILVLGQHELDYPRNILTKKLIQRAGYKVIHKHSRGLDFFRLWVLLYHCFRHARGVEAVFVTEGGHRFVPYLKFAANFMGRKLIFDAFTSRYNTYVEDRKKFSPRSLGALYCWWLDWSSMKWSDFQVFDTHEHREYFSQRYPINNHSHIIEVGVDQKIFTPQPIPHLSTDSLQVLFYGTFIPLQGIEHIIDAAIILRDNLSIKFTIIGRGQTRPFINEKIQSSKLTNLTLLEPVSLTEISNHLCSADIVLGIFGDSLKAGNVIPNKVVQAAAVGRPIITRDSKAINRYFQNESSIITIPAANGLALANELSRLQKQIDKREQLALGARRVFEKYFSEQALTKSMALVLNNATHC